MPAFVITGLPALLIILAILAIFILGIIAFVRLSARGAKHVADGIGHHRHDAT